MNRLGELLTRFLVENPAAIPLYVLGFWLLVIRPLLNARARDKKPLSQPTSDGVNYDRFIAFLRDGHHDWISTRPIFDRVYKDRLPLPHERLIATRYYPNGVSVLLTTEFLNLVITANANGEQRSDIRTVALDDIASCETTKALKAKNRKAVITMVDGERLELLNLAYIRPFEQLSKLIDSQKSKSVLPVASSK